MKKTFMLALALTASIVSAATVTTYTWDGEANDNQWENGANWDNTNNPTWTPASNNVNYADVGVIGNQLTSLTVTSNGNALGAHTIILGDKVNLVASNSGNREINLESLTLGNESSIKVSGYTSAGVNYDISIDFGNVGMTSVNTGDSWAVDFSGNNRTWGNNHSFTISGSLDASVFSSVAEGETVTINLVRFAYGEASGNFAPINFVNSIDTSAFADDSRLKIIDETTNGVHTFSLKYSNIPEPTTATLSLLALAGLAARRRRK